MSDDINHWAVPSPPARAGHEVVHSLEEIAYNQERIERDQARISRTLMEMELRDTVAPFFSVLVLFVVAFQQVPELLTSAGLPELTPQAWDRVAAVSLIAALVALAAGGLFNLNMRRQVAKAEARVARLIDEPRLRDEARA